MATKTASIPTNDLPEPLSADSIERLDYVPEDSNYYVTLQLGSRQSWGRYSGQPRKIVGSGKDAVGIHNPKVVEAGPVTGKVANGLISHHNEWLYDYQTRSQRHGEKTNWPGHLDRQLVVLKTQKTTDLPPSTANDTHGVAALHGLMEAVAQKAVSEVLGTST